MDFLEKAWKWIKVILIALAISFVVWLGYNLVQTFTAGNTTPLFTTIIEKIEDWLEEKGTTDGGKGNGGVNGESDEVPDEEKGIIDFTDDQVEDFKDYIEDINKGGTTYPENDAEEDLYYDFDDYLPRDLITVEEFKQSGGNVIKKLKYRGKNYMYYSLCFYTDDDKSDIIRFFGYFPADAYHPNPENILYSFLPFGEIFTTAQALDNWYGAEMPYPEISYHYFSNLNKIYEYEFDNVLDSAFLSFSLDDYNLYLKHNNEILKVVRGTNKVLGIFQVQPKQHELFTLLADHFVYSNDYHNGKIYNFDFGKHLDYVNNSDRVKMDLLYDKYICPHENNTELLSDKTFTVDPSCEVEGYVYKLCYCCGQAVVQETIPALEHSWTVVETTATCTEPGVAKQYCDNCENYRNIEVEPYGHLYQTVISTTATCANPGYETVKCLSCDSTIEREAEATGNHNYVEETVNPTCTTNGYHKTYCTVCSKISSNQTLSATGHTYGEWVVSVSENKAIKKRECHCGHIETALNDTEELVSINVGDVFVYGSKKFEIIELDYYNTDFKEYSIGDTINDAEGLFKFFAYKDSSDNKTYVGFYSIYKFDKQIRFSYSTSNFMPVNSGIHFSFVEWSDVNNCGLNMYEFPATITGLMTYEDIIY